MDKERCEFCKADFRPGILKKGKCVECEKAYPGAESMKEWKDKQNPALKENEAAMRKSVTKILHETLEELGILSCCECGEVYYKRSPAQKSCGRCKGDS